MSGSFERRKTLEIYSEEVFHPTQNNKANPLDQKWSDFIHGFHPIPP